MRILAVQESDWLRRNPHQQHQMLERLSAQGHTVLVVDYPIRWRDEGKGLFAPRRVNRHVAKIVPNADVTVVRTATIRIGGVGKLIWLATNTLELGRAFRVFKPDVVVVLGLSNGLIAQRMAKVARVPVVVHLIDALHTLAEPQRFQPIAAKVESALLRAADRVVVINRALEQYAIGMGAQSHRIAWIPSGVDTSLYGSSSDWAAVRAHYGIGPQDFVLLFSGWLYTFSGLLELALDMVANPNEWKHMRLLVVGDGDLLPSLKRIRDERLGDRLILVGKQTPDRIPAFVTASDVCILPAHVNSTMAHVVPAKLYEYLAATKPVLASPLPGVVREFGHDAGIIYVTDPETLRKEAASLQADPSKVTMLGVRGRLAVESTGTWDDVTKGFYDVLASVLPGAGDGSSSQPRPGRV